VVSELGNRLHAEILNSDQSLYGILTENELEISRHIYFTEQVRSQGGTARRAGATMADDEVLDWRTAGGVAKGE
jgi:hypothetical protein